ncbi:hypothetical protein CDV55_105852 [Aspergillus turcosus]|uniref:Chitin-binding type-2 domain-containing protein n=1 Tax=Aspergillus turcosus TaxID=1245748 RepID=A0A229YKM5_9EURO|nr:hypothetical protein CDV55_105852 [Aspergillus turcosus]RLL99111.1 hypothetical protein CFD26_104361 [Aspergillus turcosus]
MQVVALFLALAHATMALAAPASHVDTNVARGDSGCYPFADPDCGVSGTFCQCANGDFYLFNEDTQNCNPPWGYVGSTESSLPGYWC